MLVPPEDHLAEARLVPAPPRLPMPRIAMPVPIDPLGVKGPNRHRAQSRAWRGLGRGWVVETGALVDQPAQGIVEAAVSLRLGERNPGEAVTGLSSLHLAGARYLDGTTTHGQSLPIRVISRWARRALPGVASSRATLRPDEIVMRHGIPCANIHRALLDELCALADLGTKGSDTMLREAVVMIDMVLFAELTSKKRFASYLATAPRRRGLKLARAALALAVEGSESPRETLMRLIWVLDAKLPPPLCNRPICPAEGTFLARPDLLSPECGVVGEYDALHHKQTGRRSKDITREGVVRNHGLEYFSFIAGELNDRVRAVQRMHDAVRRAGQGLRSVTWSLTPTSWPLDERLALRELELELTHGRPALELLQRDTPEAAVR